MIVTAITTYNRIEFLKRFLWSYEQTFNRNLDHCIIIGDDGSNDGTNEYIESLKIPNTEILLIKNNRQGVHHQFNTIVNELEKIDFDYCFKCDDDIEFTKPGWEQLYIDAMGKTGYDHLCHFDISWRSEKNLREPVQQDGLISHCQAKDVQGAFFTLTPRVIKEIGYMDIENFGFRGVGHVDYTVRACRAGFNNINHPFDVLNSNEFIKHQSDDYKSAMDKDVQNALERDEESSRKYKLVSDSARRYIPFKINEHTLDNNTEKRLLKKRIEDLESQKMWYEKTYGHQPKWFVRIGKIIAKIINLFK